MRQFRLVHIGVAAALSAAAVTSVGIVQSVGAAGAGTASVLVPITPCRLIDTRAGADNVGTRSMPIGSNEAATFAVWGTNGNCTIPTSATGIASNATAVNPTSSSYVTFYPADANPRPTASNLNFVAAAPPTPNQVTVGLSATGAIGVYNLSGTVDLVVDIVGYYEAAPTGGVVNNDARYYTKPQVDAVVGSATAAAGNATAAANAAQATATAAQTTANAAQKSFHHDMYSSRSLDVDAVGNLATINGCRANSNPTPVNGYLPIVVPIGARLISVDVAILDGPSADLYAVTLFREALSGSFLVGSQLATATGGTTSTLVHHLLTPTATEIADASRTYYVHMNSLRNSSNGFCNAQVTYDTNG